MTVLAVVSLVWALVGAGALATAVWRARRGTPASRLGAATAPPASTVLIRPCAGDEVGLQERLVSVLRARAARMPRVRVAIASARDPARGAAAAAVARLVAAGVDASVVVTGARGANQKVAQLSAVLAREPAEHVIWADSDVDLSGADLDALVAPLAEPDVGAVWAPPVERGPVETLGDRASQAVLGGSLHAFVLLRHVDPDLLVGKLVAVRPRALSAVRFSSMTDVLGEDVELARRLRAAGWRVAVAPFVAVATARGRSLASVLARHARWIAMVRAQRPGHLAGYPLILAATPLVIAAASIAATAAPRPAAAAVAVAIATRLVASLVAARLSGRVVSLRTGIVDSLLADLVLLSAFVRALASRRLSWRGRPLRLDAGRLLPSDPLDPPAGASVPWRSS